MQGVRSQLSADNLTCVSSDPDLIFRAAKCTAEYVRLVGQEPCSWVPSDAGDTWMLEFDVRGLGWHIDSSLRGWATTLTARVSVAAKDVKALLVVLDREGRGLPKARLCPY